MGNHNYCRDPTNSVKKRELNQISQRYKINQFKQPSKDIPTYQNLKHACLADLLMLKGQKYIDQIYPNSSLVHKSINWQRLLKVYPKARIHNNGCFDFSIDTKSNHPNRNFMKAVQYLKTQPSYLTKIFANLQISEVGFYVLYFCMNGNVQKPIQIIIDDFIPVDSRGTYLFSKQNQNLVWMILLQKAWAKVLGGYEFIDYLQAQQIFEQMTGIPRQQLCRPNYHLSSKLMPFDANSSKYLKFTLTHPIQIILSVWEYYDYQKCQKIQNNCSFILQLIKQQTNEPPQFKLVNAIYKSQSNKVTLGNNDFLHLNAGNYILHIFNRSDITSNNNLVTYSNQRVYLHVRQQSQFKNMKHRMIKNLYKQLHNSLQISHEYEVNLRFVWMQHRGILCLKNAKKGEQKCKKIRVKILADFQHLIFFQDEKQSQFRQKIIKNGEHCFFIFIRKIDEQFGKFYSIDSENL